MQLAFHLLFAEELLLSGASINTGIFNFDGYSHGTVFYDAR